MKSFTTCACGIAQVDCDYHKPVLPDSWFIQTEYVYEDLVKSLTPRQTG